MQSLSMFSNISVKFSDYPDSCQTLVPWHIRYPDKWDNWQQASITDNGQYHAHIQYITGIVKSLQIKWLKNVLAMYMWTHSTQHR